MKKSLFISLFFCLNLLWADFLNYYHSVIEYSSISYTYSYLNKTTQDLTLKIFAENTVKESFQIKANHKSSRNKTATINASALFGIIFSKNKNYYYTPPFFYPEDLEYDWRIEVSNGQQTITYYYDQMKSPNDLFYPKYYQKDSTGNYSYTFTDEMFE